jgi:uncharacterized membrane protein HdeD (DUF308 family)
MSNPGSENQKGPCGHKGTEVLAQHLRRSEVMSSSTSYKEIAQRVVVQFGVRRGVLLSVGLACLVLGALAIAMPARLFGEAIRLVGVLLLASGAIRAAQLFLGLGSADGRRRGWPVIACQVFLDVAMGLVLFNDWRASLRLTTMCFGLLFLAEGLLLAYIALRAPKDETGWALATCGLITTAVGLIILLRLVPDPIAYAGVFVGIKLLAFGAALTWIALRALRSEQALLYESAVLEPEIAELYAVYFGTAFHLGVYIGHGEVVHYLDDNHVHRATWEQFLDCRSPQHWTYPDLHAAPTEDVVATAISEVGKTYPYSFLKFNCEHFSIFCKTGGKSTYSKYAQTVGSVADVVSNPFLGTIAELNTRIMEWLAFHFGGPAGRRFSLAIRKTGAAVTNFLLLSGRRHARPMRSQSTSPSGTPKREDPGLAGDQEIPAL